MTTYNELIEPEMWGKDQQFQTTILQHILRTPPDFWDGVFCKNS